jgi:hypothetical protein
MIVFKSQIKLNTVCKGRYLRIKAVRGHAPSTIVSCFLKPKFIVCSQLFSVSRGSLINLCRVLQRPGKRGGSFLLVVRRHFRRGHPWRPYTIKFSEGGKLREVRTIIVLVISFLVKTYNTKY